jgi:hypothetical protein
MIRFVTEMQDSEFFSEASRAQLLGGLGTDARRIGPEAIVVKSHLHAARWWLRAFNAGESYRREPPRIRESWRDT